MNKPDGVTEEQWAKWKEVTKQSDTELKNSFERVARINLQIGEMVERERIIKLLEPLAKHDESCYEEGKVSCYFEDCHASSYQYAIELIKGEQK